MASYEPSRARHRPSGPSWATSTSKPSAVRPSATAAASSSSSSTTSTRITELCRSGSFPASPALRSLSGAPIRVGLVRRATIHARGSFLIAHKLPSAGSQGRRVPGSLEARPTAIGGMAGTPHPHARPTKASNFPDDRNLRGARPPRRPRRGPGAPGHHRTVPHPGAHHRRRPRRARRAAARPRPAPARPSPSASRSSAASARPSPATRAASSSCRPASSPPRSPTRSGPSARCASARSGPSTAACPWTRRSTALQKGVDVVVGTPGRLIDLIERGELSVGARRGARRRRGRPHGRHGLHAAGPEDPLPASDADAPDDAVLGDARRRGEAAGRPLHGRPRARTRSTTTEPTVDEMDHRLPRRPPDGQGEGRRRRSRRAPTARSCSCAPSAAPTGS